MERYFLIVQARLSSAYSWQISPWIYALLLFLWLFFLAVVRAHPEGIPGLDLAKATQAAWLIGNGQSPDLSLSGGESYLAQNASYIIYPIAQITRVLPTVGTLIFLQSFALSLAVVPLFGIARKLGKLQFGACTALALVYSLYVSVHSLNLSGFSPATLALPALFYMMYIGLDAPQKTYTYQFAFRYWLLVLFILACRADLGLAVAGFGVLLLFEKKRDLGLMTLAVGLGWTILSVMVIQAQLGEGYPAVETYLDYGSNPIAVFWGMLTDPGSIISDIRTLQNFQSIVSLLAPLVFLPLVRARYFVVVLPLYFFYLISDVPTDVLGEAEQTVVMTAFLFLATIFALKRIGYVLVERVRVNLYLLWVLILAATMFFIQDSTSSFYNKPWEWNNRQDSIEEVIDLVPDTAPVSATSNLLSSLAEREEVYELIITDDSPTINARRASQGVDWIVIDTTLIWMEDPFREEKIKEFEDALLSESWQRVGEAGEVLGFKKTISPSS